MKLVGFLLLLFVGMSVVTHGQNINKLSKKFSKAVDQNNLKEVVVQGKAILRSFEKTIEN